MRNKAQAGDAIKYLIIAVVMIAIILFGYYSLQKIQVKICHTELAKFELSLKDLDTTVKAGSVSEKSFDIPCNADEVYFFDLNEPPAPEVMESLPLMKDSVLSKAQKNVFLIKDNEIVESLYIGNLSLSHPSYLCIVPQYEKMSLFIEGNGKSVSIVPACQQAECTYLPMHPTNSEAAMILSEAKRFGDSAYCKNCPRYVMDEFARFVQTNENFELSRKYEYCPETGLTNVEVEIRPKNGAEGQSLILFESIPKDCIDNLQKYLAQPLDPERADIKADPLIMWRFDKIKSEEKFSYTLNAELSKECREAIRGIAVAKVIENGIIVEVPDMPAPGAGNSGQNTAPTFSLPAQQRMQARIGEAQLILEDVVEFARDTETPREQLGFNVVKQTNPDSAECFISLNRHLLCIPKVNEATYSDVTVEAFDLGLKTESKFRLYLYPYVAATTCGDNVCQGSEDCVSCQKDCGICTVDSPQKRFLCAYLEGGQRCSKEVVCEDRISLYGDIGKCGCLFGLNCKQQYNCAEYKLTSCEAQPSCGEGIKQAEMPC